VPDISLDQADQKIFKIAYQRNEKLKFRILWGGGIKIGGLSLEVLHVIN